MKETFPVKVGLKIYKAPKAVDDKPIDKKEWLYDVDEIGRQMLEHWIKEGFADRDNPIGALFLIEASLKKLDYVEGDPNGKRSFSILGDNLDFLYLESIINRAMYNLIPKIPMQVLDPKGVLQDVLP